MPWLQKSAQCGQNNRPLLALVKNRFTARVIDPVVLALATVPSAPARFDVSFALESVKDWIEHPFGPFELSSGTL